MGLSLTVSQIFTIFYFPLKIRMAAKSGNFYLLHRILLQYPMVKNLLEMALSLTVSEMFTIFLLAAKLLHRINLYYPVGQKFARNGSIPYAFQDIFNFLFSARIQDGCHKLRKLKFFPFQIDTLVLPCSEIHSKLLYLLWFPRYLHFFSFAKIQDGRHKKN